MATQPQQQSSSKEGSKENTILNGPRHNTERSAQGHPSGSTDKKPQAPAPTAPTRQAGGTPQVPPVNNQNRDNQDPPECNDTTNGSTRAAANGKGPGATKSRKNASETHPGTVASTGPASQPLTCQRTPLYVLDVAKVATGAEIVHIIISVIFVE